MVRTKSRGKTARRKKLLQSTECTSTTSSISHVSVSTRWPSASSGFVGNQLPVLSSSFGDNAQNFRKFRKHQNRRRKKLLRQLQVESLLEHQYQEMATLSVENSAGSSNYYQQFECAQKPPNFLPVDYQQHQQQQQMLLTQFSTHFVPVQPIALPPEYYQPGLYFFPIANFNPSDCLSNYMTEPAADDTTYEYDYQAPLSKRAKKRQRRLIRLEFEAQQQQQQQQDLIFSHLPSSELQFPEDPDGMIAEAQPAPILIGKKRKRQRHNRRRRHTRTAPERLAAKSVQSVAPIETPTSFIENESTFSTAPQAEQSIDECFDFHSAGLKMITMISSGSMQQ